MWRFVATHDMVRPNSEHEPQTESRHPLSQASGASNESNLSGMQVVLRIAREYLRPFAKLVAIALIANLVVAITTGGVPWLIQQAVDRVFQQQNPTMLVLIPIAAIVVMVIKAGATYVANLLMNEIGQRIVARIQISMFSHIMRADLAWISNTHSGRFISSFMTDAARVRDAVTTTIINLTQNLFTVFALIGAMFYMNWRLAILGSAVIPIAALFMRKLGRRTRKATRQGLEGTGDLSALVSEALSGIRVVKAYGQEDREIERARETVHRVLAHLMKAVRARTAASPITEALSGIGVAAVIYYGGVQVQAGNLTLGELTGFLAAMMLAYQPLKAVANLQTLMQEGIAAALRLFPILDIEPKVVTLQGAKPLTVSDGAIRFEDVHFLYGDGTAALKGVSIEVPRGHTVALVGPSGGGKSTILNLVPRFYDATSGQVLVDEQNVRQVTLDSLRRASSLVTQEPFLFDDTVRANIAYGQPGANDVDIETAARNAAAHDFIIALPHGYDTRVGEAGLKLSGGQRQRIAIARAMLKNAPILLLDEATSALDTASEMQVQTALSALMKGRTTLVIAHRLSTIIHADNIYVIDGGRVVEEGTHHALVAKGGLYAQLNRTQQRQEDSPEAPVFIPDAPARTSIAGE